MAIQPIALQGLQVAPLSGGFAGFEQGRRLRLDQEQGARAQESADAEKRARTASVLGRALSFVEAQPEDKRPAALERYKQVALQLEPGAADTIARVTLDDLPALKAATVEEMTALQQFTLETMKAKAPYELESARLGVEGSRLGLDEARLGLQRGAQDLEAGVLDMAGRRVQNRIAETDLATKEAQNAYYQRGGAFGDVAPAADGGAVVAALYPGARITSTRRAADDPLTRANPNSWHAKSGGAVDVAPIPGMTFEEYVDGFRQRGIPIIEARNEVGAGRSPHATGDHWHVVLGEAPAGGAGAAGVPGPAAATGPGGAPVAPVAAPASIVDASANDPRMQNLLSRLAAADRAGDTAGARRLGDLIEARMKEIAPKTEEEQLDLATKRANLARAEREAAGGMTRNVRISDSALKQMGKVGEAWTQVGELVGGFDDSFAGFGAGGDWANWEAQRIGVLGAQSDRGAQWWQQYQARKNLIRNELFGSALTPGEAAEFDKADISPNMRPSQIRENLRRQQEVIQRAAKRAALPRLAQGSDAEAVEAALDVPLSALGIDPAAVGTRYRGKRFEPGGISADVDAILQGYGIE